MPDWRSRLAVSYVDEDKQAAEITPIDSFSPTFSTSAEVLHSLEQTHIGMVFTPQNITFSMTVRAIGDAVANLTRLAMLGKRFDGERNQGASHGFGEVVADHGGGPSRTVGRRVQVTAGPSERPNRMALPEPVGAGGGHDLGWAALPS